MPVSMSGSWDISGNVLLDPVAPLTATVSATTTVSALQNQTLSSFNPLSSATGGYPPYTYIVSSGILPAGLALNSSTGLVSGIPTTVQNSAPTVFAVLDRYGTQSANTASVNFAVQTLPVVATVGTTSSLSVYKNQPITSFYAFDSASNGFAPYTYFVSSGTLPAGITIDASTGQVSGTPTVAQAAANVIFGVKDSQNNQSPTTATVSFTILEVSISINYLVVGGGGGGGSGVNAGYGQGGGGGAGGLLSGSIFAAPGSFTITVGGGGPGGIYVIPPSNLGVTGVPGSPSSFTGPSISPITAIGGGGGGLPATCAPGVAGPGQPGGSGGGGGGATRPPGVFTIGTGGTGTPTQGFPGGAGSGSPQPTPTQASGGGGGGGAGGAGIASSTPLSKPGNGGAGLTWACTGPGVFYAGGGGGAATAAAPQSVGGSGGSGVGGNGATTGGVPGYATPGTNSTGSGGGGGGFGSIPPGAGLNGANGGSGVVIVSIPNAQYPQVVAPGAAVSTPPAAPGRTVLTYTTPTPLSPSTYTLTIVPTYTIQYLIVAGGGSGGASYGGGGAGGVLTGSANVVAGQPYSITVGGGGPAAGPFIGPYPAGNPGQPSTALGLTATGGGGGGGSGCSGPTFFAKPGGSGGGGTGIGTLGTGIPGQGYPGGAAGAAPPVGYYTGGGGGGAGGAGTSGAPRGGGPGGPGVLWPYTGLIYGGGGGAGANPFTVPTPLVPTTPITAGSGGAGGGGSGFGGTSPTSPLQGTPGLGGGGGGSGYPGPGAIPQFGSGGSGTVIIAVSTAIYPGVSAPGAVVTTPPAAPGYTVLTYTAASPTAPSTFTFIA